LDEKEIIKKADEIVQGISKRQCVVEYTPYALSLSVVSKLIVLMGLRRITTEFIKILLKKQELIEKLPEDLKRLFYTAKLKKVAGVLDENGVAGYLAGVLRKNRINFVKLIRQIDLKNNQKTCDEREVIELFEPDYVKICIDYVSDPFFSFQSSVPLLALRLNKKTRSLYLKVIGSGYNYYSSLRRSEKNSVSLQKNITMLKDFSGIFIVLKYHIARKYYHVSYGKYESSYSKAYGVLYNFLNRSAIFFKLKSTIQLPVESVKELLRFIHPKEKAKVKAWISSS